MVASPHLPSILLLVRELISPVQSQRVGGQAVDYSLSLYYRKVFFLDQRVVYLITFNNDRNVK